MKTLFSVLLLCLTATGCSTMYGRQNDEQRVFFDASPAEVQVVCSGKPVLTPGNLLLKQSKSHRCYAEKEGYEKESFRIRSKITKEGFKHSTDMNTAKWGKWTLGIGTLIGWTVDFVSGAMRDLEKDRVDIVLRPDGSSSRTESVLESSKNIARAIAEMPKQVVDQTTEALFDSTVRTASETAGISSADARENTETQVEGKRLVERLEKT